MHYQMTLCFIILFYFNFHRGTLIVNSLVRLDGAFSISRNHITMCLRWVNIIVEDSIIIILLILIP